MFNMYWHIFMSEGVSQFIRPRLQSAFGFIVGIQGQASPFADATPYSTRTEGNLEKLTKLNPKTFAAIHGASFAGDGATALRELGIVMREVPGNQEA
jgi:hypothetical protein